MLNFEAASKLRHPEKVAVVKQGFREALPRACSTRNDSRLPRGLFEEDATLRRSLALCSFDEFRSGLSLRVAQGAF